jgi:hypothetical protein
MRSDERELCHRAMMCLWSVLACAKVRQPFCEGDFVPVLDVFRCSFLWRYKLRAQFSVQTPSADFYNVAQYKPLWVVAHFPSTHICKQNRREHDAG